jgi:hypothetical protein
VQSVWFVVDLFLLNDEVQRLIFAFFSRFCLTLQIINRLYDESIQSQGSFPPRTKDSCESFDNFQERKSSFSSVAHLEKID